MSRRCCSKVIFMNHLISYLILTPILKKRPPASCFPRQVNRDRLHIQTVRHRIWGEEIAVCRLLLLSLSCTCTQLDARSSSHAYLRHLCWVRTNGRGSEPRRFLPACSRLTAERGRRARDVEAAHESRRALGLS